MQRGGTRPALVALALVAACARAPARFPGASLVVVSIDTLRADAVEGFGSAPARTPALRRLGDEGIRIDAVAATHYTAPSHTTLLTGFSPDVHRVSRILAGKACLIPAEIPTLAERLRSAGYRTAAFLDGAELTRETFERGFDVFTSETTGLDAKAHAIEAEVLATSSRPLFLLAHTYRAHHPYQCPSDLLDECIADYDGVFAEPTRRASRLPRGLVASSTHLSPLLLGECARSAGDRAFLRRLYRSGVTGADREVGRLLDRLRRSPIFERAIVIVTSDHGEALFEHGRSSHDDVFDENLRVPLIVRLPHGARGGTRATGSLAAVDFAPTVLDLLGLPLDPQPEGRSRADAMLSGEPVGDLAFAAWFASDRVPIGFAARRGSRKRIEVDHASPEVAPRCFDLAADPDETAGAPCDDAESEELGRELWTVRRRWAALRDGFRVDESSSAPIGSAVADELRALGYTR